MRNRFMIYRKGHSVASALLFVLLIAHLLLPLLAWLGSAAGFPLGNLFSSEGIRWYYLHIQDCYRSPFMTVVFPVVLVLGAIERSGLSEIIEDSVSKGVLSLTYRQRKACLMAGTFLLFIYEAGRNACLYCIGESNVMMYGFSSPCWPCNSTMPYAMYGTEPKEDGRKVFKT